MYVYISLFILIIYYLTKPVKTRCYKRKAVLSEFRHLNVHYEK